MKIVNCGEAIQTEKPVKPHVKAIVLRTARFKETLAFFRDQIGFIIKETSPTHFVIHSKGIRILFVASMEGQGEGPAEGPEVELYLTGNSAKGLIVQQDPNQIKIIISPGQEKRLLL